MECIYFQENFISPFAQANIAESIDVCDTSQEDVLALDSSRDDLPSLETNRNSDILGGDDGKDWQDDDQDHLDGLVTLPRDHTSAMWFPSKSPKPLQFHTNALVPG